MGNFTISALSPLPDPVEINILMLLIIKNRWSSNNKAIKLLQRKETDTRFNEIGHRAVVNNVIDSTVAFCGECTP